MVFPITCWSGEKTIHDDWMSEIGGAYNEAYTASAKNVSFGVFCSEDKCLFYLHQNLSCVPGGGKYSALMNVATVSATVSIECTAIGGNLFQVLDPFEVILRGVEAGGEISFVVSLQSGTFLASKFSLRGANIAIARVLTEAAKRGLNNALPHVPPTVIEKPKQIGGYI